MFEKKKISIIAGSQGREKSVFALKNANELQEFYKKNVLYIDLESKARLVKSNNNKFFAIGITDKNKIAKFIEEECAKRKEKGGVLDVVFVDSLQLITEKGNLKDSIYDRCIKDFKIMARELSIHIVLLTQCEKVEDNIGLVKLPEYIANNLDNDTTLYYIYNFKYFKKNKLNSTKAIRTVK